MKGVDDGLGVGAIGHDGKASRFPRRILDRQWMTGMGHGPYRSGMCRSSQTLRRPGEAATTGELEAAARQYVRKISGYREPSARNQEAFDAAIAEIAHASQHLVEALGIDVEDGPNKWVGRDGVIHTGA